VLQWVTDTLLIGIFPYATILEQNSEDEAIKFTKNVDVAICQQISMYVVGIALYYHYVVPSNAVVLAQ